MCSSILKQIMMERNIAHVAKHIDRHELVKAPFSAIRSCVDGQLILVGIAPYPLL
jgi:hypothetical protein